MYSAPPPKTHTRSQGLLCLSLFPCLSFSLGSHYCFPHRTERRIGDDDANQTPGKTGTDRVIAYTRAWEKRRRRLSCLSMSG